MLLTLLSRLALFENQEVTSEALSTCDFASKSPHVQLLLL